MEKVLLAVDDSECSDRAVRWAITTGDIRSFVGNEAIETYQREEGDECFGSAFKALDAAKIACTPHILLGPVGPSVADFSAQNGCDGTVMGTRGLGGLTGLVLGSVATQALQVASVPVTLIK